MRTGRNGQRDAEWEWRKWPLLDVGTPVLLTTRPKPAPLGVCVGESSAGRETSPGTRSSVR